MKILVDTHILLWWFMDSPKLSDRARREILHEANTFFISAVSLWEIEIKRVLGKLNAPEHAALRQGLDTNRIRIIPLEPEHAAAFGALPATHGDPFDRMLVAQALTEDLTIMTHDKQISDYSVPCLLV